MATSKRVLCQFSCGATSAVATKLAIARYSATHEVLILNAFLVNEHADNRRFADDCAGWFGRDLTVLRDTKFGADALEVFRRRGYIKGAHGAPCTTELKRALLRQVELPGDIIVLGFDVSEQDRLDDFRERWPDRIAIAPLIEAGLTKDDCKAMLQRAGIELPAMYRMGYDNANCIGCVKGGEYYFRAIREDFPEQFNALADVEESIGEGAFLFRDRKTGKRWSLRQLGDGPIRRNDALPSCSFFCELAELEYSA